VPACCAACAPPTWRISYGAWLVLSLTRRPNVQAQAQQSWWAVGELTGLRPPLRFCCWGSSWAYGSARPGSGDDPIDDVEPSREASALPTGAVIAVTSLSCICGQHTPPHRGARRAPRSTIDATEREGRSAAGGSSRLSAPVEGSRSAGSRVRLRVLGPLIMC